MENKNQKLLNHSNSKDEIILYQLENAIEVEVRLENETVWLTQAQIAKLFGVKQPAVSKHLKNIFLSAELNESSVYSILEYTAILVSDLIKSAKKSIVLIDNYIDETVLLLLSKRLPKVSAKIYTKHISSQLQLDLVKHNAQYEPVNIYKSNNFHDRFLLIDNVVYHIGASLKDLGKKLFAFSKMEIKGSEILKNL